MLFASRQIRFLSNVNKVFTKTYFQDTYFASIFSTTYLSYILLIITAKQIPESLRQTSRVYLSINNNQVQLCIIDTTEHRHKIALF
jgi:hypothetical protein